MCVYLCMKKDKGERGQERVRPEEGEMKHFQNAPYFSQTWPDIPLSINLKCFKLNQWSNEKGTSLTD